MGAIAKQVIHALEENAREVRKTKKEQVGQKQAWKSWKKSEPIFMKFKMQKKSLG